MNLKKGKRAYEPMKDRKKKKKLSHLSPPIFCCISRLGAGAQAHGDVGAACVLSCCTGTAEAILFDFT
jgi:hypothetical protein